ncbi:MAG: hypothetical protein AAB680_00160 [Pseudomonadota bacterium]
MNDASSPLTAETVQIALAHKLQLRDENVHRLRQGLIALAAISVILFVGFLIFTALSGNVNRSRDVVKGNDLVIENPRFIGHSRKGGTVTVTAVQAKRALGNVGGIVELSKPKMTTSSGAEVYGDSGKWNQATQELSLENQVVMIHKKGQRASAQHAFWRPETGTIEFLGGVIITVGDGSAISNRLNFDANGGVIKGDGGVQITLPFGVANSEVYEYYPETQRFKLRGNAKMIFKRRQ